MVIVLLESTLSNSLEQNLELLKKHCSVTVYIVNSLRTSRNFGSNRVSLAEA